MLCFDKTAAQLAKRGARKRSRRPFPVKKPITDPIVSGLAYLVCEGNLDCTYCKKPLGNEDIVRCTGSLIFKVTDGGRQSSGRGPRCDSIFYLTCLYDHAKEEYKMSKDTIRDCVKRFDYLCRGCFTCQYSKKFVCGSELAKKRAYKRVRRASPVKKPRDEKDKKDKEDKEDDHEEVASKKRKDNPKTTNPQKNVDSTEQPAVSKSAHRMNTRGRPSTTDEGSTPFQPRRSRRNSVSAVENFNLHGNSTLSPTQLEEVRELVLNTSNSYQETEYHTKRKQKRESQTPKISYVAIIQKS